MVKRLNNGIASLWSGPDVVGHVAASTLQVHPSSPHLGCTTSVQSAHQAAEDMLPGTLSTVRNFTFNFNVSTSVNICQFGSQNYPQVSKVSCEFRRVSESP